VHYVDERLVGARAVCDRDETLAAWAREYVVRWDARYNRNQSSPLPAQLADLAAALPAAEPRLPPDTVASLRFVMQSFTRG